MDATQLVLPATTTPSRQKRILVWIAICISALFANLWAY